MVKKQLEESKSDHADRGAKHGAWQLVSICRCLECFISFHPHDHHVRRKSWDLNPELTPGPAAPQLSPCHLQKGELVSQLCPWVTCVWFIGVFGDSVLSETSNYPEFWDHSFSLTPYVTKVFLYLLVSCPNPERGQWKSISKFSVLSPRVGTRSGKQAFPH